MRVAHQRRTFLIMLFGSVILTTSGCGRSETEIIDQLYGEYIAILSRDDTDPFEKAHQIQQLDVSEVPTDLATAIQTSAVRSHQFAEAVVATNSYYLRQQENFPVDMFQSILRGATGDPFGRAIEMSHEGAAMQSQFTAAQAAHFSAIREVQFVAARYIDVATEDESNATYDAEDNVQDAAEASWISTWIWRLIAVGFVTMCIAELRAEAVRKEFCKKPVATQQHVATRQRCYEEQLNVALTRTGPWCGLLTPVGFHIVAGFENWSFWWLPVCVLFAVIVAFLVTANELQQLAADNQSASHPPSPPDSDQRSQQRDNPRIAHKQS